MPFEDPEETEVWLRMLAARGRSKMRDNVTNEGDHSEVTDLFIAEAGVAAVRQVSIMAAPRTLERLSFAEIQAVVLAKIRPKKRLVIAERTRFLAITQRSTEKVRHYAQRLWEAAQFCEFHRLNHAENTQSAEELIQMRFIDGPADAAHRSKLLEYMQATTIPLSMANCL